VLPEELTPYFTEKPLYVEGSFIPLTQSAPLSVSTTRAEHGLPEDAFVMAAFGNVYKITPEMFSIWMEILQEIPNSVLWLIDDNAATTRNLREFATAKQADLSQIIFSPRTAHSEYLAKLALADVFLDTFPYNCGSTSNDVIAAGVPLLTMQGKTMVSKMGSSILLSCQQTNTIVDSFENYKATCLNIKLIPKVAPDQKYFNISTVSNTIMNLIYAK
jgi:predicted O-linked N-acetylglucosamine transferase (SPINDLY family)